MKKPIIGITIGDPAGIGPEVTLKALLNQKIHNLCHPLVIGDSRIIASYLPSFRKISSITQAQFLYPIIDVLDLKNISPTQINLGKPTRRSTKAAFDYIKTAVKLALEKKIDALVTAPISKKGLFLSGLKWPGHTQMLKDLTKSKQVAMVFISPSFKIALLTTHIPLKEVPINVKKAEIVSLVKMIYKYSFLFNLSEPKIGIAALNPHAGEDGFLGDEEEEIVKAIKILQKEKINVSGPYPADTVFVKAKNKEIDFVIAMYHDQAMIPVKLLEWEKAVNVSLGLPFMRTSPAHGTAYDIAGKNKANPESMIEAIKLAAKLTRNKERWNDRQ